MARLFETAAIVSLLCAATALAVPATAQTLRERIKERSAEKPASKAGTIKLAGLDVAVWPAQNAKGPAPVILFSHGFNGCNTQSTFLMEALAQAGYTVFAPNHKDAACGNGVSKAEESFRDAASWTDQTYRDRHNDMTGLVTALRGSPEWAPRLDWTRAGLAGHSLGGYTALGLDGGWASWKQTTFKAVLAMSPYCEPFVKSGSLGAVAAPVMYQGGTRDLGITPSVKKPQGCYDRTASQAFFVEFSGAGHFAWTDRQTETQELIVRYSLAFFDQFLNNKVSADLRTRAPGVSDLRWK
jgi:pimeloyl-ACP methyl ester carboxylesterase